MSTIYLIHGKEGPWELDDDGVVMDGFLREGVVAAGPTLDGVEIVVLPQSRGPVGGLVNLHNVGLTHGRDPHRRNR